MNQKLWIERHILDSLPGELVWALANDFTKEARAYLVNEGLYERRSESETAIAMPTTLALAIKEAIRERLGVDA
jgi:hypothetical protein